MPMGKSQTQASTMAQHHEIATVLAYNATYKADSKVPLTKAMSLRNKSDMATYITSHGILIGPDVNGETEAVMCACQHGHISVLEQLKKFGINVHARDQDGFSSLHTAALNGYADIVDYLISEGADVEATANDGSTSLMCASQNGHTQVINLLLAFGAKPGAKTKSGFTALHFAAVNGEKSVVSLLTTDRRCLSPRSGIDVNCSDDDGVTPLMCACFSGQLDVVRILLLLGARQFDTNHDGMSSLSYAIAAGHLEVVKLLAPLPPTGSQRSKSAMPQGMESLIDEAVAQAREVAVELGQHHIASYLNSHHPKSA